MNKYELNEIAKESVDRRLFFLSAPQ